MLVFVEERLCIIQNTKCASSSMHSLLSDRADIVLRGHTSLKHIEFSLAKPLLPYILPAGLSADEFEFIGLVRQPIDWLQSWYKYRQRPAIKKTPRHVGNISFDRFISDSIPESQQFNYLKEIGGDLGVDKAFAFERLDLFENYLSKKLSCAIRLPIKNTSKNLNAVNHLNISPETLQIIEKKFRKDFLLHASCLETVDGYIDQQGFSDFEKANKHLIPVSSL